MRQVIQHVEKMDEVLSHLEKGRTHLFIDIDNTLFQSSDPIGSIQWQDYLVEEYVKGGMDPDHARFRARHLWKALQHVIQVGLTEDELPNFLKSVKSSEIPITLVTARSSDVIEITHKQLESLNLHVSHPVIDHEYHIDGIDVLVRKGTIFCGDASKGEAIKAFLKTINSEASKAILVDDDIDNLLKAKEALEASTLEFVGLRYGFLDEKVKNYSPEGSHHLLHKLFTDSAVFPFLSKSFFDSKG